MYSVYTYGDKNVKGSTNYKFSFTCFPLSPLSPRRPVEPLAPWHENTIPILISRQISFEMTEEKSIKHHTLIPLDPGLPGFPTDPGNP